MAVTRDGRHLGPLSGGCVEDDFLKCLAEEQFEQAASVICYGDIDQGGHITLPCGGILEVLVGRLPATPDSWKHLGKLKAALEGHHPLMRHIDTGSGKRFFTNDGTLGPW